MWQCLRCSEAVDDTLDVCWNCEANRLGALPGGIPPSDETHEKAELRRFLSKKHGPKKCATCQSALKFIGSKKFHEGFNFGVFGDFAELFVRHTNLEMYMCPECLRVEFFISDPVA